MSLRARIAVLVAFVVALSALFAGIGTAVTSRNLAQERLDARLLADADTIDVASRDVGPRIVNLLRARQATCGVDSTARLAGRERRFISEFAAAMQVIDSSGTVLSACRVLPIDEAALQIAADQQGRSYRSVDIDGERFRVLTVGVADIGAVQFARDLDLTEETLSGLVGRLALFGLVGAAIAAVLGWLLAGRATSPVRQLSGTAERVAATGDLGERIAVERSDEIGDLATSFNTMLASLDESRAQQRRLVQDASHELRTPLTSLRTNVEMLQRHRDLDPEVRNQMLDDIRAEVTELTELTTELVESATAVDPRNVDRIEVTLADVVRAAADRTRRRSGRTIVEQLDDSVVSGDAALLRRAVDNLLANAVKFSDGDIEVRVEAGGVVVADRGPGIADEDLAHVFERFWRATGARSQPGSGLGLSIVRQIAEVHGGTAHAANREGGGAVIGFSLPTIPPT